MLEEDYEQNIETLYNLFNELESYFHNNFEYLPNTNKSRSSKSYTKKEVIKLPDNITTRRYNFNSQRRLTFNSVTGEIDDYYINENGEKVKVYVGSGYKIPTKIVDGEEVIDTSTNKLQKVDRRNSENYFYTFIQSDEYFGKTKLGFFNLLASIQLIIGLLYILPRTMFDIPSYYFKGHVFVFYIHFLLWFYLAFQLYLTGYFEDYKRFKKARKNENTDKVLARYTRSLGIIIITTVISLSIFLMEMYYVFINKSSYDYEKYRSTVFNPENILYLIQIIFELMNEN